MKTKKIKYIVLGIFVCIWLGNIAVFIPSENNFSVTENQDKIPLQPSNSEITIITPENKTYTSAMSGYYPATYGFENDDVGSDPDDFNVWEGGGPVNVINSLGGHHKVVQIHDDTTLDWTGFYNLFEQSQSTGTIETYVRFSHTNKHHELSIRDVGATNFLYLGFIDGSIWYNDGGGWINTGTNFVANKWYHVKIEFDCSINKNWHLWINDTSIDNGLGYDFYGDPQKMDRIFFGTHTSDYDYDYYIDAIGYSWDENYEIRDNWDDGLLLSFGTTEVLEWIGYSLDSLSNKTIRGNSSIPLPSNGTHTIQIFGNNSIGNMSQSDIRYFTMDYNLIKIITPENTTYLNPMSGYYPATYGFENDENGSIPNDWDYWPSGTGCPTEVIDEFDNHKKVVRLMDASSSDYAKMGYLYPFNVKLSTLEFWYYPDTECHSEITLWLYNTQFIYVQFLHTDNSIRYFDGIQYYEIYSNYIEKWYHFQFEIDYDNNRYDIYIDGNLEMDNAKFRSSVDSCNSIIFTTWQDLVGSVYLDAVGLSTDPNYQIGDNLEEGMLVSFENDTSLVRAAYSLNNQIKQSILGNTTLSLPDDGVHIIQLFARDSSGNIYESELMFFNISVGPFVKWRSPIENQTVILPFGAPIFPLQYSYRKIVNVTLEINGFDFGEVWNQTSTILSFYNSSIDGEVNAVLHGYEEGKSYSTVSDSINFVLSKIELEIIELLDYDTEFLGQQLYMIIHDPNGDNSFSGFAEETGLSIGVGLSMEVGAGLEVGVGNMDEGLGASGKVEFKYSTSYDMSLEITDKTELTSSLEDDDKDYIGPGRGDTYWGESWVFNWKLRAYYRTYFNGTTRYEEPRIDYTIIRNAEVLLSDYNAPSQWKNQNPIHNNWSNVDWSAGSVISVDGARKYGYTHEVERSEKRRQEFQISIGAEVGGTLGFVKLKYSFYLDVQSYMESEEKTKYTTSFTIEDDEATDHISMEYGIDNTFGTPIFRTIPNICQTSNPLEYDTFDYVPPYIQFPEIEYDSSNDGIYPCMDDSPIVNVEITDEGGIQAALLMYSINNGSDWNFLNLTEQVANPGIWDGIIPSQEHGTSVLWYIRAWDNEGFPTIRKDPHGNDYIYTVINRDPIISLISPNGGEIFDDNITIQWTASDLDGDSLTYEISYNDGGFGWHLIADSITGTSYTWDISDFFYSDSILIKVIVHDGYGGLAEDTSNYLFTIEGRIPTKGAEFPLFETVSIVSIGVAVFAVLATGVLFRKSRMAK